MMAGSKERKKSMGRLPTAFYVSSLVGVGKRGGRRLAVSMSQYLDLRQPPRTYPDAI